MVQHQDWQRRRRRQQDNNGAEGNGAATATATIPRGGGVRYLLGQVSLMMWGWVRWHLSPMWEDKVDFWGEVRARYGIKNMSAFCAFAFVLNLPHNCCCLWAMVHNDLV